MVRIAPLGGGTGISTSPPSRTSRASTPFSLEGTVNFRPRYAPDTIRVRKRREVDGKANICGGEDVTDTGSKNRRIHITGQVLREEVDDAHALPDGGDSFILTSATWSGDVLIKEVELEGPMRYDPSEEQFLWEYTIDAIATGKEEDVGTGIIDDGSTDESGIDIPAEMLR